ncbi:MAG TPA: hypothetical protein EYM84_06985 [Flavobacteriales bacterium]|nr:hypothetical protein [Flavobacteriales bacterium]
MSGIAGQLSNKAHKDFSLYLNNSSNEGYSGEATTNVFHSTSGISTLPTDNLGFDVRNGATFYKIYYNKNQGEGTALSLSRGPYDPSDIIYKMNYWEMTTSSNRHGFQRELAIGKSYTFSVDVLVSKSHPRTGYGAVVSYAPENETGVYHYYNFDNRGEWQTIKFFIKSVAYAGTSGTSGGSTENRIYSIYLDAALFIHPLTPIKHGYVLFKNPQLELNKDYYADETHATKFINGSRGSASGWKDLLVDGNHLNLNNIIYNRDSEINFSRISTGASGAITYYPTKYGSYADIGLSDSRRFKVGSTTKRTYDFWLKKTEQNISDSILLYADVIPTGTSGIFTAANTSGVGSKRQSIRIIESAIYCDFMDDSNNLFRSYTGQVISESNKWYNITISVNTTLTSESKVKFFINGSLVTNTVVSSLNAPSNIDLSLTFSSTSTLDSFSRYYYKASSTDKYGIESAASKYKSIQLGNMETSSSVLVKWGEVTNANGYKIYRSTSSVFEANSLLATVSGSKSTSFWDKGSPVVSGAPLAAPELKYSSTMTSFYDGSDLALSLGSAPIEDNVNDNYFEGQISMLHIYKTNLSSSRVSRNFEINKKKFPSIGLVGTGEGSMATSSTSTGASGASGGGY